ncbi:hypothetical protein [Streptomyces sp. SID13031]|uniref:hypothetical protein n=1 Tax=Streptomyces sp. SID13031 TaxID=2706046 RepID=UPI0013C9FB93|nr:hypothetical protein [Streptomyces sp. SID13031]NEA31861.1 hypothetical protein [Streptomyces sp. SID13031]
MTAEKPPADQPEAPAEQAPTTIPAEAVAATPAGARVARVALGVFGVGFGLCGLRLLLQAVSVDALVRLPLWLGGAVVVDDFFLVPLTVSAGWLVTHWAMGPDRHRLVGTVRTTLLYVGVTTLIAIPLLIRQGKGVNPTVLPRDYLRDWLLLEATIVAVGVLVLVVQRRRLTFSRSRASSGDIGGR